MWMKKQKFGCMDKKRLCILLSYKVWSKWLNMWYWRLRDFDSINKQHKFLSSFTVRVRLWYIWVIYLVDKWMHGSWGKMGLEASFGLQAHLWACILGCAVYTWQETVDVIFYIHQDVFVTIFTERTRCFIVDGLFCAAALLGRLQGRSVAYFPCLYWMGNVFVQVLRWPA